MLKKYTTASFKQTQKLGENFAGEILLSQTSQKTAVVIGLSGNLGGGKTTFLQGFAKGLGVKEKILSPTFVIYKKFTLPSDRVPRRMTGQNLKRRNFYHFDCYRLKNEKDILELGFKEIISNPENIVAIEWPEKIYPSGHKQKVLPKNTSLIEFKFTSKNKREINFKI